MTIDKKTVVSAALGAMASVCAAGDVIPLPAPDLGMKVPLMQAIQDRESRREFGSEAISKEDLGNLLWVANGINRKDGKRTTPTGMNKQEISVYAITPEGAYKYLPKEHALEKVSDSDLRGSVGAGQDFVKTAPLALVFTCKMNTFPASERSTIIYGVDAGHGSQDVLLYCSAAKLACVPRMTMDNEALTKALKLTGDERPIFNDVIGHIKK